MKSPKKFCYYCNHIIDYKRQCFIQCNGCETVCHVDCTDSNCNQIIPKMKLKNIGKKGWKITNKNEFSTPATAYTCNKCCLKVTPFNSIITNSKGAIKKQFRQRRKVPEEPRKISDCIEPDFLNSLFFSTEEGADDKNSPHNLDEGFNPLPDKYYNGNHIELDDYNLCSLGQTYVLDSTKFSSLGINMRSLANTKNFAKLQVFVASLCFQPTVIAINETYLRDNEDGPHCDFENYTFKSNCRKTCKGGGVGLYIHNSLQYKIREDLSIMNEKVFESFFIETLNLDKPVIFGTIYRSPKQDNETVSFFMNDLDECLKILDKSNKSCFIQGDLNFNLIDMEDNNIGHFKEKMFDYSFYSLINKPTRITDKTATCIDHIWSNIFDDKIISGIFTEMIADHMATFQSCNIGSKKNCKQKTKRGQGSQKN